MKRKLTRILQKWLQEHEGWHNKAHLLTFTWKYDNSFKTYSPATVDRKLREATEEGLIFSRLNEKGQTEYMAEPKKKPFYQYDPISRVMREI